MSIRLVSVLFLFVGAAFASEVELNGRKFPDEANRNHRAADDRDHVDHHLSYPTAR